MYKLGVGIGVALIAALPMSAFADDGARALVEGVRNAVPKTTAISRAKLTSSRGWEREIEIFSERTDDTLSTFMEVIGPQDVKDTRFLFFERVAEADEQHIYIPLIKRAMRIADDTRKQAFLGSDFYVSDLIAPNPQQYDYRIVGEEEVLGRPCRLVEAVPKDLEGELYSRAIFAVDPKDHLILQTTFFDLGGDRLKVWKVEKLEKIQDHWTILRHTVENVQDKTSSTLALESIEYGATLPSGIFTRARLLR